MADPGHRVHADRRHGHVHQAKRAWRAGAGARLGLLHFSVPLGPVEGGYEELLSNSLHMLGCLRSFKPCLAQ